MDGQRLTNMDGIEAAIGAALGDVELFEATVDGKGITQHTVAARELAAQLNELTKGIEDGDSRNKTVGTMLGYSLALDATAYNAGKAGSQIDTSVSLVDADGATVSSVGLSLVAVNQSYVTSNLRNAVSDLFKSVERMASRNDADYLQRQMERAINELPALRERLNQTFPKAGDLATKRARLRELVSLLDNDHAPILTSGSNYIVLESEREPGKWYVVTEGRFRFGNSGAAFQSEEAATEHARSVTGNEPTEVIPAKNAQDGVSFSRSPASAGPKTTGLYSALSREIDALPTKSAPVMGWQMAITGLVKNGKIKADEVEWSGLNDWLQMQTGKVAKEDVTAYAIGTSDAYGGNANVMPVYLRMDNPRIEEVDGPPSEWWDKNGDGLYWELDVSGSGHRPLEVRLASSAFVGESLAARIRLWSCRYERRHIAISSGRRHPTCTLQGQPQ